MNTQRIRPWLLTLSCLFIFVGCAKRPCGEPLPETPESITLLEWKLTRSSDPGVNEILSPFTFSVFKFEEKGQGGESGYYGEELFDGTIRRAKSNVLEDVSEKTQTFRYSLLGPHLMYFELVPSQFTQEPPVEKEYAYELSRQGLSLQDLDSGDVYTFCPFTGSDSPEAAFGGN